MHLTRLVPLLIMTALASCGHDQDPRASKATPGDSSEIRVLNVYRVGPDSTDPRRWNAGIGDIVAVEVNNLDSLLRRSKCLTDSGTLRANCDPQEICLFLDGRKIVGLEPESGAPQGDKGELQFHLSRNPSNDEAWADILGSPGTRYFFHRPTRVSVGLANEYAVPTNVQQFHLKRVREFRFFACLGLLAVYFIILGWLAFRSGLLRDRSMDISLLFPELSSSIPAELRRLTPFSLARFQMAFWFSLVIVCYLFIWLITGAYDIVTPSILTLIGISVGTSLGSAVIDNNKSDEMLKNAAALLEEKNTLSHDVKALQPSGSSVADAATQVIIRQKEARIDQIQQDLLEVQTQLKPKTSKGFFKDILSDANGVSFHRLQMFVWTLVLGLLFLFSVWARLSMPEFPATLLALQGITAGTYLGFKIPEKPAA